jgi:hypothetical protein
MKRRRVKTEETMQEEGELEGDQSNLRWKAVLHVISLLTLFSKLSLYKRYPWLRKGRSGFISLS